MALEAYVHLPLCFGTHAHSLSYSALHWLYVLHLLAFRIGRHIAWSDDFTINCKYAFSIFLPPNKPSGGLFYCFSSLHEHALQFFAAAEKKKICLFHKNVKRSESEFTWNVKLQVLLNKAILWNFVANCMAQLESIQRIVLILPWHWNHKSLLLFSAWFSIYLISELPVDVMSMRNL